VVLLDLRLPKIDGMEVLKQMKNEENLKDIPVIVLTASEKAKDIIGTYEEGVSSYLMQSAFIVQKTGKMEEKRCKRISKLVSCIMNPGFIFLCM